MLASKQHKAKIKNPHLAVNEHMAACLSVQGSRRTTQLDGAGQQSNLALILSTPVMLGKEYMNEYKADQERVLHSLQHAS